MNTHVCWSHGEKKCFLMNYWYLIFKKKNTYTYLYQSYVNKRWGNGDGDGERENGCFFFFLHDRISSMIFKGTIEYGMDGMVYMK